MTRKTILVALGIALFVLIVGASGVYGVLAYSAGPAGITSISADGVQERQDAGAGQDPSSMVTAEDFVVETPDGQDVALSSLKGKPVLVIFWTSWCTYCKQEMPSIQELYNQYGNDVEFMLVNATTEARETREKAETYLAETGYMMPYYFDTEGSAISAFSVRGFPTTYLVDRDGYLAGFASGVVEKSDLEAALRSVLQ